MVDRQAGAVWKNKFFSAQVGASGWISLRCAVVCGLCSIFKILFLPHKGARRCTQVHIGAHTRHTRYENVQLRAVDVEGVVQQD